MKVLGKNVVIGTKKICVKFTSAIQGGFDDSIVEIEEYVGANIETNVIFIRDKKGYLIELKDLGSFPTLSLICFGAATRWKTTPLNAGDYYIDDIKPYFDENSQETLFDIKSLMLLIKNLNKESQNTISIN